MNTMKNTIVEVWNAAQQFLANIDLREIGRNIIQGLINGISSMASALWEKVKSIADSVKMRCVMHSISTLHLASCATKSGNGYR